MPYNEKIDQRICDVIIDWNTTRKKMFGGTCHLVNGNMLCGVYKDFLILRLGQESAQEALSKKHVTVFDITGKPMKGWVMVNEEGFKGQALKKWLIQAREFAESLPPK